MTAKLNMADGVDGGLWLDDSVEVARLFESDGALDALELTGGSSLANPMYLFRGDAPLREFGATLPAAVRLGFRVVGHRFLKSYPYEEAFFLPYAAPVQDAPCPCRSFCSAASASWRPIESALAEGFAFVAMARALLREPDLPNRMQAGTSTTSLCIHCNKCMPTIYSGTRSSWWTTTAPVLPRPGPAAGARPRRRLLELAGQRRAASPRRRSGRRTARRSAARPRSSAAAARSRADPSR